MMILLFLLLVLAVAVSGLGWITLHVLWIAAAVLTVVAIVGYFSHPQSGPWFRW